jgi:hypothetical protein
MFRQGSNDTRDPEAPVIGVDHQGEIIVVVVLLGGGVFAW